MLTWTILCQVNPLLQMSSGDLSSCTGIKIVWILNPVRHCVNNINYVAFDYACSSWCSALSQEHKEKQFQILQNIVVSFILDVGVVPELAHSILLFLLRRVRFTFYNTAIHHWNSLPNNITGISGFNSFKKSKGGYKKVLTLLRHTLLVFVWMEF